jgi:hypothetical protein
MAKQLGTHSNQGLVLRLRENCPDAIPEFERAIARAAGLPEKARSVRATRPAWQTRRVMRFAASS